MSTFAPPQLASQRSRASRWLRIPEPGRAVRDWHVSPVVDAAAYHWSWLWVLVPLLACGPTFPVDYAPWFMAVLSVSFVHRHATLGYVYANPEILSQHRRRYLVFPILAGCGLLATPTLLATDLDVGPAVVHLKALVTSVVFAAGLWNVWHVLAQKYGILRIYEAKARAEDERAGVAGWVDRLFVLGWLPLVALVLASKLSEFIAGEYRIARWFVEPALEGLRDVAPAATPLAALIAVAGGVVWLRFEWRAHRLRNRPRLSMALGTGALWTSLLLFDPIKVYLAFAFSHAVEYLVFIWAVQRRTWAKRERANVHSWLPWSLAAVALGAFYFALSDWRELNFWSGPSAELAGLPIGHWVFYWGVWQSLLHFAYDGMLWRTRNPAVRALL